jgi:hypothetical protein
LTENADQRRPPRGVRSCIVSSCAAISRNVLLGSPLLTPAQNERLIDLHLREHGGRQPPLRDDKRVELATLVAIAGSDDPNWPRR